MPPKEMSEQGINFEAVLHPIQWVQAKLGEIAAGVGMDTIEQPVSPAEPQTAANASPEMARALRGGQSDKNR